MLLKRISIYLLTEIPFGYIYQFANVKFLTIMYYRVK
jgi:hypothetical protein